MVASIGIDSSSQSGSVKIVYGFSVERRPWMMIGTGLSVCIVAVSVTSPDSDGWFSPAHVPGGPDQAPDDVPDTSIVKTPFSALAKALAAGARTAPAHSAISRRRIS